MPIVPRIVFTRLAVFVLLVSAALARADDTAFPRTIQISADDKHHELAYTGEAKRVVLFFRVYDIAHYAVTGSQQSLTPEAVVVDGPAKAIMINFSRELGRDQIKEEFDKSLRRNAEPAWLSEAQPTITAFIDTIDRGAVEGDQLVFYWLPGGRVITEFNGELAFEAADTAFAKSIWSIWFGAKPACDSEQLLASYGDVAP